MPNASGGDTDHPSFSNQASKADWEDETVGLPRGKGDPDTFGYPGEAELQADLKDQDDTSTGSETNQPF